MRATMVVALIAMLSSTAASSQSAPLPPKDSISTATDSLGGKGVPVPDGIVPDSSRGKGLPIPIDISRARSRSHSRTCARFGQTKCALAGAFLVGGLGYLIGDASAPKAEHTYRNPLDGGSISGGEACTANCGVPRQAVVLAVSGSALGGLAGWLLGRK